MEQFLKLREEVNTKKSMLPKKPQNKSTNRIDQPSKEFVQFKKGWNSQRRTRLVRRRNGPMEDQWEIQS